METTNNNHANDYVQIERVTTDQLMQEIAELRKQLSDAEHHNKLLKDGVEYNLQSYESMKSIHHEWREEVFNSVKDVCSMYVNDADKITLLIEAMTNDRSIIGDVLNKLDYSAEDIYKYYLDGDRVQEMIDVLKQNGDTTEIEYDDVCKWIQDNDNYADELWDEIKCHLDEGRVCENAYNDMSSREQRDFLSEKLGELSDDEFRNVVTGN